MGLVCWGEVPATQMVRDGVTLPRDVILNEFKVEPGGEEPNLAQAELHGAGARTTRVKGEDAVSVIAFDDEPEALEGWTPEL